VLHGNDGAVLAQVRTSGDGKARFALPATKLAPPRAETLVASFAGNKTLSPSSDSQPVIVRSTAHVTLAEDVQAVARGEVGELLLELKPPHGVVQTGVVEATHQGRSVGSAPVTNGRARLRFDVDPGSAERFELTVQYLPSSPWWRPGAPLRVVVPVDPPSILTRVMLGLVVLLGIAGVIVSWHRSRKLPALNTRRRPLAAGVHVVTSRRGARGYSGTVVDAHDGRPLGGVTIIVRAPSLQDDGVLHRCETDRYGAFAFELDGRPEGTEMMAESGSHSAERKHLPGGGRFRIALMTRRRAVLRRFAAWVKRSGKPYEIEPEATPAHVRRTADNGDITDWASEVEVAAFSAAQVSKHVEHRLRDNEP